MTTQEETSMFRPKFLLAIAAALALGFGARSASADVTFSASGSGGDGPISATATFAAGPTDGLMTITLTNTQTGQMHNGQAVSDLSFTVTGINTPNAFNTLGGTSIDLTGKAMGSTWTLADGTSFSDTVSGNVDRHWGFSTSSATVTLATAGSGAPGGSPTNMILPAAGIVEDGLPAANHQPYLIGDTTFTLAVTGLTAGTDLTSANISNVVFSFGTGPDSFLNGGVVPEPSTLAIASFGALGFIGFGLRRRLKK
jgi:hypothetical protein